MLPPGEPEDDGNDFGPPLPPDDRLWRHPSEFGPGGPGGPGGLTPEATPSRRDRRRGTPWFAGVVAGLTGAAAALAVVAVAGGFDDRVVERDVIERVAAAPAVTLPIGRTSGSAPAGGVAALAGLVAPAIARLEVERPAPDQAGGRLTVAGSAVVFRDNGYLLTTADLMADSESVSVILAGGDLHDGEVVGTDSVTNVAVVKIDAEQLHTAILGSVDGLLVGGPIVTIGSPATPSGGPEVTAGIVSALGSTIAATESDIPARHDLIETDAPLAPRSSGGALLDRRGSVIGITMALPDGKREGGLSFAIPIDTARSVADEIIETGAAHHPWLGIEGSDVVATAAADLHLDGGARVATVTEGSPAERAGLTVDDVITSVGDLPVTSMASLVVELRRHDPGETVTISFLRDGEPGSCTPTLEERQA